MHLVLRIRFKVDPPSAGFLLFNTNVIDIAIAIAIAQFIPITKLRITQIYIKWIY